MFMRTKQWLGWHVELSSFTLDLLHLFISSLASTGIREGARTVAALSFPDEADISSEEDSGLNLFSLCFRKSVFLNARPTDTETANLITGAKPNKASSKAAITWTIHQIRSMYFILSLHPTLESRV